MLRYTAEALGGHWTETRDWEAGDTAPGDASATLVLVDEAPGTGVVEGGLLGGGVVVEGLVESGVVGRGLVESGVVVGRGLVGGGVVVGRGLVERGVVVEGGGGRKAAAYSAITRTMQTDRRITSPARVRNLMTTSQGAMDVWME